jgi:hypothetical protein
MGFVVECGFLAGKFLDGLVLDLISRKSFPHVKSTKGLGCHAATTTPFALHQTFSGRASSRTVRVIPFKPLPQAFHPVGQSAQAEILESLVSLSTRSAAGKQLDLVRS